MTREEAAGPFVVIPEDVMEQSKLEAMGYSSVLERLGEQMHASPILLKRLNPGMEDARELAGMVAPGIAADLTR